MNIPTSKVPSIKQSAEQGDPLAQYILGWMYYVGNHVKKDLPTALTWYEKAAEQGNPKAQFNLSNIYRRGRGVQRNPERAVYWTEKAANNGVAKAQASLGIHYFTGSGVSASDMAAYEWLSIAVLSDPTLRMHRLLRRIVRLFLKADELVTAQQRVTEWLQNQKEGPKPLF